MRIVKAYTLDHFTDESSAEQLISDGLGTGYYHSLFEARDALIASVTRFTERLEAARVQFANDVIGTLTLEGIPCDETIRPFLNDAAARIEESKTNLRIDEVVNGICLSFDAVAIRKIYVTTASILGKITARQAASLTTGVGCCAVDGPLPIGDCVAVLVFVGGTAWSIYDIYEVVSILPNEMKVTLNEITEEFINRSLEEVKSVGELRYRNYRKLCSLD